MCRGLSKTQKTIIEVLKCEKERHNREWYDVSSLMWQIKNGLDCFSKFDFEPVEPSNVEKQSYWRAIRLLEKRGFLESRKKRATGLDRIAEGRGGASTLKQVRLSVEFNSEANCTKQLQTEDKSLWFAKA
jgi:hypothetical protein